MTKTSFSSKSPKFGADGDIFVLVWGFTFIILKIFRPCLSVKIRNEYFQLIVEDKGETIILPCVKPPTVCFWFLIDVTHKCQDGLREEARSIAEPNTTQPL